MEMLYQLSYNGLNFIADLPILPFFLPFLVESPTIIF